MSWSHLVDGSSSASSAPASASASWSGGSDSAARHPSTDADASQSMPAPMDPLKKRTQSMFTAPSSISGSPSMRRSRTTSAADMKEGLRSSARSLKDISLSDSAQSSDFIGSFNYKMSSIERARIQQDFENELIDTLDKSKAFELHDCLEHVKEGVQDIVQDDFSRCFEESIDTPWNWNVYLFVLWTCGIVVRYLIILPIRVLSLVVGFSFFFLVFSLVKMVPDKCIEAREEWERSLIRFACSLFVFSWTGVVRYHGVLPSHKPNRVYVANHTSLIDVVVLSQDTTFSLVGQKHGGFIGFFQDRILKSIRCLWFNRSVAKDRTEVARLIKAHIKDPKSNRLLVFPEGTCVNNNYCVQFKKGVFELGAEVCPIAIRYNPIFVNAFWNSRRVSFQRYLITLMSSWSVVADVYYLAPMSIQPNESAIAFTARVKQKICEKAGLINVKWDGYLKHFTPSARYVQARQRAIAQTLLNRLSEKERKALEQLDRADSDKLHGLMKNKSSANLKEMQSKKNE